MDGMGSMMAWMMGLGLVGWVLVIALLVTILVVLVQLLNQRKRASDSPGHGQRGPGEQPR